MDQLQALIKLLHQTTEFDPAYQLAQTISDLGQMLYTAGAYEQAVPILQDATEHWFALVEASGGRPWRQLLFSPDYSKAASELGNLSATMGELANALRNAGHHNKALAVAEEALMIEERLGEHRDVAAGHGVCARILMVMGRYDEADAHYGMALSAARQAGDKELEGVFLQHQAVLANDCSQLKRAIRLALQALQLSRERGDRGSMMRTYNLLGLIEKNAGRLAEARAWHEKSHDIAVELKDQVGIGQAAQNIGIVCQLEGDVARDRGDESYARRHYEEAKRSVEEALLIMESLGNKPGEAGSWGQLAIIHLRLGDLAVAERHAHRARQIYESLDLKEVSLVYRILSEIARIHGDLATAAEWNKKCDDLLTELERRAGGGGGMPAQMLEALQALTVACAQAGFGEVSLGPEEEEALAQLVEFPAPFPAFAAFLRQITAGRLAPIPNGLPDELREWLEELVESIGEGREGPPGTAGVPPAD